MMAVMPTIDVMPITTPSTVNPERILLVRTVSNAIETTSLTSPLLMAMVLLFAPQRLDRVELRRLHRRIQAEEQAHECRDADTERNRPQFELGGDRRKPGDHLRDRGAEHRADHAAENREDHRLGEHL